MNKLKNRIKKARTNTGTMGSMILIYTKQAMTPVELAEIEAYLQAYPLELAYWKSL